MPYTLRNQALAFCAGAIGAHWLPAAHPLWLCWLAAGIGLLVPARLRALGMALIGLGWGAWNAQELAAQRLPPSCAEAELAGRVVGLPTVRPLADGLSARTFLLASERAAAGAGGCRISGAVRLSWFGDTEIGGGERWRLQVRLRQPRGTANAHGFDRGRWYLRMKLAATGYVLHGSRLPDGVDRGAGQAGSAGHESDAATWSPNGVVDRFRERLRQRLWQLPLVHGDVIAALTIGDMAAIPADEIERYRRTGTMHLLVISGLHVAVVTALGFFVGRWAGLLLGLPAKSAGISAALALAAGYVMLAGAGLSLLRAYAMSVATLSALAGGRKSSPSAVFAYAMAVVLIIDPMAPLSAGFWLSFGAVTVLLAFFSPRPRLRSRTISALVAQLVVVLAFAPASVSVTGLIHPLSVVVNLVVVPAVTLFVVPVSLAGVALVGTPAGEWLLYGADFGIAVIAEALAAADRVEPFYVVDLGRWHVWLVLAAAACLLPLSRLARAALGATMLALLAVPLATPPAVAAGEVEITMLDVGQGTALVVATARHTLLYDAGVRFPSGADSGANVVLPTLRATGRRRVDVLMISHGDLDHAGGAASVLAGADVERVLAGEPVAGIDSTPCEAGSSWRWDGVYFEVLNPPPGADRRGNDASCVLLIETRQTRALLAGDIERRVEGQLDAGPVDFLLVPHHGSATSSGIAFVAATQPRFAAVSAGFGNRFGHPHANVLERYRDVGAHIVSSAVSGALRWRSDEPTRIERQRDRGPYWQRQDAAMSGH